MKKRNILILLAAVAGLASCDMDKMPYDSIPDSEALQTPTDFSNMREGLYTGLRSMVGGDYSVQTIQGDEFNAVNGFSNTLGDAYRWDFTNSFGTASNIYGSYQTMINRANFLIDGYDKCDMSNTTLFTDAAKATIKIIKGEAFFTRAYSLFYLAQYFCADYEASTADAAHSGVSYRLDYNPSADKSTYPGRNTLNETVKQIKADLDSSAVYLTTEGSMGSPRLTVDAITALRARLALWQDDYAAAAQYASSLVESGTYSLCEVDADIEDMWQQDGALESIVQFAVASNESAPQLGIRYLPYSTNSIADYIPTQATVDLFSDDDFRKSVYFKETTLTTAAGATGKVFLFNKYIDHTRIWSEIGSQSESYRFMIEPKMFRIAEMYLIAAEAYAQAGDLTKANKYLKELEEMRIMDINYQDYTSTNTFMAELRKEREREMLGEGTRMFDLKRWHMGVKRGTPQQEDLCNLPGSTTTTALDKPYGDVRMVWPIPKAEIDANPNVQQNPGY